MLSYVDLQLAALMKWRKAKYRKYGEKQNISAGVKMGIWR